VSDWRLNAWTSRLLEILGIYFVPKRL
jgi:hypothetical protein